MYYVLYIYTLDDDVMLCVYVYPRRASVLLFKIQQERERGVTQSPARERKRSYSKSSKRILAVERRAEDTADRQIAASERMAMTVMRSRTSMRRTSTGARKARNCTSRASLVNARSGGVAAVSVVGAVAAARRAAVVCKAAVRV